MIKDEFSVLFARIDDLCERAERGEIVWSNFLSPRERHFAKGYLISSGMSDRCLFYGGYNGAERCRAYILPDYISGVKDYSELSAYLDENNITSLRIRGSGYRKLSHRDYLGSVLGLGIERDILGDIVFQDRAENEAIVFCDSLIANFILNDLKKVANDSVRVDKIEILNDFIPKKEFLHISDTVSSPRVDCVVAALCSLSRERASVAVMSGTVEVDFECETRPDKTLKAPCLISVRGYGKFKVNSVSEPTRRGRLRLDADKFI